MTPQTVNAYFNPTQNEIVFPAAILQPPFFHQNINTIDFAIGDISGLSENEILFAANLGSIGAIIAHEITHGYDDQGCKFDGDGNLQDWWTSEDMKLFETKKSSMESQTTYYQFVENNNVHKLNANLTMGENLADLGGISLAKKALLKVLQENQASSSVIEKSLKIFFSSWANSWKENVTNEYLKNGLSSDPHSPGDFRCNLVRNFNEFYETFNVTEGDKMYLPPENRIVMW